MSVKKVSNWDWCAHAIKNLFFVIFSLPSMVIFV